MSPSEDVGAALGPLLEVTGRDARTLDEGWEVAWAPAGESPLPPAGGDLVWYPARVPGTVGALGLPDHDLDGCDHWYRHTFDAPGAGGRVLLSFDGLTAPAEAWLDGAPLLTSDDTFHAHAIDVTDRLGATSTLLLRFPALGPVLASRRPRGRWPTRLVSDKNLRFVRTTLIGSLPGFCPPGRPIGPWGAVRLVVERGVSVEDLGIAATLEDGAGVLDARLVLRVPGPTVRAATLVVGDARARLDVTAASEGRQTLSGRATIDGVRPWWPHTHGDPVLHPARVELDRGEGTETITLPAVGFRRLERDPGDGFGLRVNGVPIFCRGACWTPLDVAAIHAGPEALRAALAQVVDAGMNMLRVPGPMAYESDAFHRLCDELGILVWQDFMFSNMDYPTDPAFLGAVEREAHQLLARIGSRPSTAVLCGSNEVTQQAAMMGLPREDWAHPIFDELLPRVCAARAPAVPYVPSSPSGGAMPFHVAEGPSHYYGVGAYLRPLEDARGAKVAFASECLAFSNVPEDASLGAWLGPDRAPAHHPRFKERVPRDGGAGWDFADVTDAYVERLFGVDTRALRYADHDRYLRLSRAAVAEVMAEVQGAFRSADTPCRGALVWFLRDLWDGPGWGVVDARGLPKAPWYALRRAWSPLALWLVDDGVDGLTLHADNERPEAVAGRLVVALHRPDGGVVARSERAFALGPREARRLPVEGELGRFVDSSYAYRFGPPAHSLVTARLEADDGAVLAEAFHLPLGRAVPVEPDVGLRATAEAQSDGSFLVTAAADRFAQSVAVEVKGWRPTDAYFHLAPGVPHRFSLVPLEGAGKPRAKLRALNATRAAQVEVSP